jgi:predicted GIY-YIG superfamily endonuclease
MSFHYVYILQSVGNSDHFHVGLTDDLHKRLREHNSGEVSHTAKFRPWVIKAAIAFRDRERASAFERYLKSGSGRAFAKRHFQFSFAHRCVPRTRSACGGLAAP